MSFLRRWTVKGLPRGDPAIEARVGPGRTPGSRGSWPCYPAAEALHTRRPAAYTSGLDSRSALDRRLRSPRRTAAEPVPPRSEGETMRLYEAVYIFDAALDEAAINEKLERFHG